MLIFAFVALFNSAILSLLGLLVFKKNFNLPASRNLAYFILCIAAWYVAYFFWQTAPDADTAYSLLKLTMFWVVIIPAFYFRFSLFFIGNFSRWRFDLLLAYAITICLVVLNQLGLIASGVTGTSAYVNYAPVAGPMLFLMVAFYLSIVVYAFTLLLMDYKNQPPIRKKQIKYIIGGTLFVYVVNITNYFSWFGINLPPVGNFFLAFGLVAIAYTIITKHVMDFRLVFRKTTIRLASFAVMLLVVFTFEFLFYTLFPEQDSWFDIFLIVSMIALYPSLKHKFNHFANRYFSTSFYNPAEILAQLSERFSTTLNVDAIYDLIAGTATTAFRTTSIALFNYDEANDIMVAFSSFGFREEMGDINLNPALKKYFFNKNLPIIIDECQVDNALAKKFLKKIQVADVEILVPLTAGNKIVGAVYLGRKITDDIYNDDDLKFLNAVCSQAAMALVNAKLYQEVSSFNRTLEAKVAKQTKDIRAKNEHLEKLLALRSEFLDIASHQLRTPVSVIRGVLSMIEEGSIPKDKEKYFLRGAIEKSTKLGEIINDLLRASEMDSDKFILKIVPVDLNVVFKKIIEDKTRSALIREIDLKFDLPQPLLPQVLGDERYIEHAIVNLINNSLQYTKAGYVKVSTEITSSHLIIRVEDTGIGIPANDVPNLFGKFRRGGNAVEAYADGSGLGLFIIKKIIDAIPGASVKVEKTELGKGTTMALELPLAD